MIFEGKCISNFCFLLLFLLLFCLFFETGSQYVFSFGLELEISLPQISEYWICRCVPSPTMPGLYSVSLFFGGTGV
jgi:hypothetical protein